MPGNDLLIHGHIGHTAISVTLSATIKMNKYAQITDVKKPVALATGFLILGAWK